MKKILLVFVILLFFRFTSFSQINNFGDEVATAPEYTFGVRIIPTSSSISQFYLIKESPDGKIIEQIQAISKSEFINQAMGLEDSPANPKHKDLFIKYNVFDSAKIMNNILISIDNNSNNKNIYDYQKRTRFNNIIKFLANKLTSNLWKIRYATYPLYTQSADTIGWTHNFKNPYMPDKKQMNILKKYGVIQINYYIYGENFFKLLKDMTDKNWIKAYINAGQKSKDENAIILD
jgi:hypothetical protein